MLVLKAQTERTQAANKREALARLAELVQSVAKAPIKRRATKATYGSTQRRLEGKTQRSAVKRQRGKPVE